MHQLHAASVVSALAVASHTLAGLTSLSGTGVVADGAYLGESLVPSTWQISFDFDGSLDGAATDAEFGDWSMTIRNGSMVWTAAGSGADSGRWTTSGLSRVFTVTLGSGAGAGSGNVAPAPTSVSVIYSSVRTGGSWGTLGQALIASQGSSFDPGRGGFVVRHESGGSTVGTISSGYQFVPAPGAVALVGAAAVLMRRRRG